MPVLPLVALVAPAQPPVDFAPLRAMIDAASRAATVQAQSHGGGPITAADLEVALGPLRAWGAKGGAEGREAALVAELYVTARVMKAEALARRVCAEVPVTSRAWEVSPDTLQHLPLILGPAGAPTLAKLEAEGRPEVRALLGAAAVQRLAREGALAEAGTRLAAQTRAFPQHPATAKAAATLQVAHATAVGAPAPDFSLPDLDQPTLTMTRDTFKGRFLLLDFWATWCGFCVAELPTTHRLYAQYRERGLEVLSLSADSKAEQVQTFRKRPGYAMPWRHAFLGRGAHPVLPAYGVTGFPTLFLIGPDGKILARGMELRGEALGRTLERHLGKVTPR